MKKTVLLISLCILAFFANAQSKTNGALPSLSQSDFTVIERNSEGSIKSVRYAVTDNNIPETADEFFTGTLKKRSTDDFVMDRSSESDNGMSYERYQQYYRGVIVADGHYNFRMQNGRMKVVKGHYVNVAGIDPVPSITENEATNLYASYFGTEKKDIFRSYVDLMIKEIPDADRKESIAALVYRVVLFVPDAEDKYVGYIDAHTGKLVYKENASVDYNATGQFYTYYNRDYYDTPKTGNTDCTNNVYSLTDVARKVYTYKQDPSSGIVGPFYDNDNVWTRSEMGAYNIGVDVHWTMEQIYECMVTLFSWPSYDGQSHQIESIITNNSSSAFVYSSNFFTFGNASGSTVYGPLASVDKIGHEYGHAIVYNSSQFNSGITTSPKNAIYEGLADIWGIIFENYITPSANYWKSGEQIMINGYSCERNFQSPNDATAYTQIASTYGCGAFYSTDPHIVGGLLPYWFYLLVKGGSGTNGNYNSYQLLPVGFNPARQLFKNATLTSAYLQDCDTFQDVGIALIDAAEDMGNNFFVNFGISGFFCC